MPWAYLLIASLFQVGWTYSLRYMDVKKVMAIRWLHFFEAPANIGVLIPFVANIIFGLINVYFFSAATKFIPTATALAVWMGVTLVGVNIIDITIFSQPINLPQLFFLFLILAGIVGLKLVS